MCPVLRGNKRVCNQDARAVAAGALCRIRTYMLCIVYTYLYVHNGAVFN